MVKKNISKPIFIAAALMALLLAALPANAATGIPVSSSVSVGQTQSVTAGGKTFTVLFSKIELGQAYLTVNSEPLWDGSGGSSPGETRTLNDGSKVYISSIDTVSQVTYFTITPSCTANDHKGCSGSYVYWYDSCGNQGSYVQACYYNQECTDGVCVNKCGNGVCTADENCASCVQDCACASTERCDWGTCNTYCGNGVCDANENCWGCVQDCGCSGYERCEGGTCVTYCGNGRCDGTETCGTCGSDCGCASNQECVGGKCVSLCGNNRKDPGEDCDSCIEDFPCPGTYCHNGQCVQCITNAQCEDRESYSGEFICGPDNKKVFEKGVRHHGVCTHNTCTGEKDEITRLKEDCGSMFCQDGTCGCSEGYAGCQATGKCERERSQQASQACGCDFQCKSGYCNVDGICFDAITVVLSSTKSKLAVGEELDVTVSANNALNAEVNLDLVLNLGTGVRMVSVISGMDCTGNQCKISRILAERGREDVTVTLRGEGASVAQIGASVSYIAAGKEHSIAEIEPLSLTVIHCGDGVCTEGESQQNCCGDCPGPADQRLYTYVCKKPPAGAWVRKTKPIVYIVIGGLVFILTMAYLFAAPVIKHVHERKRELEKKVDDEEQEKHKKEEKAKQTEHERERIRHVLNRIKDEINPKKPPSAKSMMSRLKDQFELELDADVFSEEYFVFIDTLKDEALAQEAEAKRREEEEKKKKRAKFCTKCGYKIREGVKFCTICGAPVRRT